MRSFTFNTDAASPKSSLIKSVSNFAHADAPEFTLGEVLPVRLYLASPSATNGYDPLSGSSSLAINVGLGQAGSSAGFDAFTTWTPIMSNGIPVGWTGTLYFNTVNLANAFSISGGGYRSSVPATLEFSYTDGSGGKVIFGSPNIRVINCILPPGNNNSQSMEINGSVSIPNGVDSATITGLALVASPRLVACTVLKPASGLNLFASAVSGTITTDGFTYNLSGVTDSENYNLVYKLIF